MLTSGTFNFNNIKLDGVDTEINYRLPLDDLGMSPEAGTLQIDSIISYLNRYTVTPADGTMPVEYAGGISDTLVTSDGENLYSHPRWKASTTLTYSNGGFSGSLHWRYIGRMANLDDPTQSVPAANYFDIDAHYKLNHSFTISFGVNNIGDKAPPFIGTLELRTDAATYDVIGRTFYASMKAKF